MFALTLFFVALALMSCSGSLSEPWEEKAESEDEEVSAIDYVTGSIWPKPQSYNATGKVYSLTSNNFSFDSTGETSDVLKQALIRYKVLVFPDPVEKPKDGLSQIIKLTLIVLDKYAPLSLESDESCKCKIIYKSVFHFENIFFKALPDFSSWIISWRLSWRYAEHNYIIRGRERVGLNQGVRLP